MDVIAKLIKLTEAGQLHWINCHNNTWTTRNNDVECKLESYIEPKISGIVTVYSLKIGGYKFVENNDRIETLLETIRKEIKQTEQKQLQVQINKFFNDNF